MGRLYTVQFENVAVSAAQDFFSFTAADDKPLQLHAVYLSQSTEMGDAAEEFLRVQIGRGHTTVGSGGSAPTPQVLDPGATASGFTARANDTTIASAGTNVVLHSETFNVRAGWLYLPTPQMQPKTHQGAGLLVVRLVAAPTDPLTMGGTAYIEEL